MKEWWNNLSLREKKTVTIGSIIGAVLLVYLLIWLPLDTKVRDLREQIHQNQKLLTWMKATDKQIHALENTSQKKNKSNGSGSLLSYVQNEIKKTPLSVSLTQINQVEGNAIQLSFKKVNFDKLISWLINITKEHNLIITQMTVSPSTAPGLVSVELVLKGL